MADTNVTPGTSSSTTAPAVDFEKALAWVDGDRELLIELVGIFLQDCPERLKELQEAVTTGDAERTQRVAHSLKGAVTGFGATSARDLAQQLEMIGKSRDLATAPETLSALEQELQRVMSGLSAPEWS